MSVSCAAPSVRQDGMVKSRSPRRPCARHLAFADRWQGGEDEGREMEGKVKMSNVSQIEGVASPMIPERHAKPEPSDLHRDPSPAAAISETFRLRPPFLLSTSPTPGASWYVPPIASHHSATAITAPRSNKPPPPPTDTPPPSQAHRILTQVFVTGARVFGRAFAEAYKQASASQKYAAAQQGSGGGAAATLSAAGLTLQEACQILNVAPPKNTAGPADLGRVHEQFKRLFDMNDPKQGGSFYLQSKVLRARERIELEVREVQARLQREEELREGWKPRLYRDR